MDYKTLFVGAATTWIMGFIFKDQSSMSVAFGLMWMGFASKFGGKP
jgi:hypothetical protein